MASTPRTIPAQAPPGRFARLHRLGPVPSRHSAGSQPTRVLIADGQALVRAGFRLLLEADPHITVVGEAASGDQAVALAQTTQPDVVLIDARLPGLDSVEATGRISAGSGPAVMLLIAAAGDERTLSALRAGARGVLLKDDTEPAELVRAVELLARGDALLSPGLTRHVIAELACQPQPADPSPELFDDLTAREREVVAHVALGLSNGEIAERLVISPATAKTHVSRAMLKLDVRDRAKLVVLAYRAGLVRPTTRSTLRPALRAA